MCQTLGFHVSTWIYELYIFILVNGEQLQSQITSKEDLVIINVC